MNEVQHLKKKDIFLLIGLAAAAAAAFLLIFLTANKGTGVKVTVDGKEYASYSLKKDITVDIKSNGVNRLVIKNGKAYISYADCSEQVCVNHKEISKVGESIICLPHKVIIEIE